MAINKAIMYIKDKSSELELRLPWPPSVNHYWGQRVVGKRVFKFIGSKGQHFRYLVKELISSHIEHCNKYFNNKLSRLSLQVIVRPPDRRRRDMDNLLKATQDALEHANAYLDDEQIDELYVIRNKDDLIKDGEILIKLSVIKGKK